MKYSIGDKVTIKSTGQIVNIISIGVEVGSQILTLSRNNEIVWNGNFRKIFSAST